MSESSTPAAAPVPPDLATMTDAERAGVVLGVIRKAGEGIPALESLNHQAFAAGSTIFDAAKGKPWDALSMAAMFYAQVANTIRTLEWMERNKAAADAQAVAPGSAVA